MKSFKSVPVFCMLLFFSFLINVGFVEAQKSSAQIFKQMISNNANRKITNNGSLYSPISGVIDLSDTILISNENCSIDDIEIIMPKSIPDFDIKNINNWQYILIDIKTANAIQYSYNYMPKPNYGMKGNSKKDGYSVGNIGNIHVLKPMKVGIYLLVRYFEMNDKKVIELNQVIFINEIIPPTLVLVDYSTVLFTEGRIELKARWFDKGGCGEGCVASYDNCTEKNELKFRFSEKFPKSESDPDVFVKQLIQFNRVFFNPETGAIMTENDYNKGIAHAWIPSENTSSRIFLAEKMNKDITQYKIKVFLWDNSAENDSYIEKNFNFGEVKIEFKF